ncbi:Eco57I restriction-modification methylase domain-containing protein [Planctomicrobium sp. SH664]|uniref:Eco57I restriction-modification methylase domain-containing protein n=1 Tax=Planctomicrobium sp. SH664 TaxID=3448125 RepID=UPI003F5C0179
MAKSPEELAHQEWIGYVQPVGLVVSIPAMLEAQCYVNKNIAVEHARFLNGLPRDGHGEIVPEIRSLPEFIQKVLNWQADDLLEVPRHGELPGNMATLEVILLQYHETLRPTYAVPVCRPKGNESPWMMLIQELASGAAFDEPGEVDSHRHWNAAPQAKFERLLRETSIPIGLLFNQRQLRLVYAPRGESSGHATFNVGEMMQVAGRPMFAALHMLLNADRMFSLGQNQRLPAILETSRKYQNTVSTKLAEQVLAALYELMRGFQAANDVTKGKLLRDVLETDPNHVYSGLLTVLMRLVFLMYAEDRDLMSSDPVYSNYYSVNGLFDRLRGDAGRHPDTMNQRFGAWSQLLTLFRLVFEGGQHGDFQLPARKGYLFDPDRYPFLEGRPRDSRDRDAIQVPRIPDGVIYRVLRNLLILDGERLSYRRLDVEQIGSVYETVMDFNLEVAQGRSIAIKPVKSHGAPATINLEALLATKGKDRAKWLKEQADQTLPKQATAQLKDAGTIDELLEALDKKIAKKVTPRVVQKGAIVLQPSDERRRSGSHYTPRSLTEPIVRTTLEPILKAMVDPAVELPKVYEPTREDKRRYTQGELAMRVRLSEKAMEAAKAARAGGSPHPYQILDLKVCDPAMGSGAFLVEVCRQLGDELVAAWHAHDCLPTDIPPDEDELLYARRLIAQRCLYGVDKNPMAVDLAKLSLWLVTLAKSHPFTFLDHSLRHGDSLVGLTRRQIVGFHWEPKKQKDMEGAVIQARLERATEERRKILDAREDTPYRDQEQRLAAADEALSVVRLIGDACVSAFFAGKKKKDRETRVDKLFGSLSEWFASGMHPDKRGPIAEAAASLRQGEHPIPPFHWEIEFPEIFGRANSGFDAFVGNPPFAGKNTLINGNRDAYPDWLKETHAESHGNADLVAHFFRRTFNLLRDSGCFGLIATNTIGQGDTRSSGLRWIGRHGGEIYHARRRLKWPGLAAVVVSVVHVCKGRFLGQRMLDGRKVETITAFLFHRGTHDDPSPLAANAGKSFQGSIVLGMGFTFDDTDTKGVATPLSEMERLITQNRRNAERIFPFIGGEEINTSPTHAHHRYVINFGEFPLERVAGSELSIAREKTWATADESERAAWLRTGRVPLDYPDPVAADWKELIQIVEMKVKPQRESDNRELYRRLWWQYCEKRIALYEKVRPLDRTLAMSEVTSHVVFSFVPSSAVYAHTTKVFAFDHNAALCVMQCRVHEVWARFFASSLEERLRYKPSDCFETFPFPPEWENDTDLERAGNEYYEFRAALMVRNDEGLTKTYNHFHNPHETSPDILKLRELHAEMDRVVLEAYGWHDLADRARCEFLLDYEEDEQDESSGKKSKRKKPWRLRWPDDLRDEVLARLLELNEQRHQEELLAAGEIEASKKPRKKAAAADKPTRKASPKKKAVSAGTRLFISDLSREQRFALLLLRAWDGKPLTRRAFNAGMILMLDDKLRKALLNPSAKPPRKQSLDIDLNQLLTDLKVEGFVDIDNAGVQQVVRITAAAPSTNDSAAEDQERVRGVQEYFRREAESGKVTISKESVDAELDLVPA